MNAKTGAWARRYQTALSRHLEDGSEANLKAAVGLGHRAVALGLETLDVAQIHEKALMTLVLPGGPSRARQRVIGRANVFFTETIVPIEKTHRAALKADDRVNQLAQTLRRRTAESSASTRHLEQGIAERRAAEATLRKSGKQHVRLLRESRRLRARLRHRTREILSVQEDNRERTSRQLHDEIGQILLAINLRLLTVKESAKGHTEDLSKRIAETQRVVQQSAKTIKRLAHELGVYHDT